MSSLTPDQVALQLDHLPHWTADGNSIHRRYLFADFAAAMGFMMHAAFIVQELEHFPNWQNHYNVVNVKIGDTNQNEMRSRDIQLAKRLDTLYTRFEQAQ